MTVVEEWCRSLLRDLVPKEHGGAMPPVGGVQLSDADLKPSLLTCGPSGTRHGDAIAIAPREAVGLEQPPLWSMSGLNGKVPDSWTATLAPSDCAYLDDLGINLKPARALGFHTVKVTDPAAALVELSRLTGVRFDEAAA